MEWSKVAGVHAWVVWHVAQLVLIAPVWLAGALWHAAQMVGAPAYVTVGCGWHFWHTTIWCAPVRLKDVTEWSKDAGVHAVVL